MDAVADFRHPPHGWPSRTALDLTEDTSIITAIANDVGVEEIFQRQVIAYGREGDAAFALSTSGGSDNIILALAEARKRGLLTIALVGYDGGRIAAEGLADHVIITRSQHIPRIQEAQAARVPRPARAGRAGAARWRLSCAASGSASGARSRGSGSAPTCSGSPPSWGSTAGC